MGLTNARLHRNGETHDDSRDVLSSEQSVQVSCSCGARTIRSWNVIENVQRRERWESGGGFSERARACL